MTRFAAALARVPVWLPGVVLLSAVSVARLGQQELWLDEAFSLAATFDLGETIRRTGGTMALYYALLTPWSQVSIDPAWLRIPGVVAMAGALAAMSSFVARQHGRAAGLLAGVFAACTYLPSRYAVEVRAYALVALLIAVSWLALDHVVADEQAERWRWVHGAALVLAPLAHGLTVIAIVAQTVAVLVARPGRRVVVHQLRVAAASAVVVVVLAVAGIGGVGDWLDPLSRENLAIYFHEFLHPLALLVPLSAALVVGGMVATVPGLRSGAPLDRFRAVALTCWGPVAMLGLLGFSVVRPSQLGRYGLSAAFGVAGLAGVALARWLNLRRGQPIGWASVVVVLVLVATSQLAIGDDDRPWTDSVEVVAAQAAAGDVVLFADPEVRLAFEATWQQDQRPPLPTLGPPAPLGDFDRFTSAGTTSSLLAEVGAGDRIWYLDHLAAHSTSRTPGALTDRRFRAAVEVLEAWEFGDVSVRLLRVR